MAQRNTVMSIAKGIAIILMVIGHAEAPELLTNFIYTFHMPLFFIAAGYFFSRKYLDDPWTFCKKRFDGLYVPFVKWTLIYLLLHNLWFEFGILNERFGNWTGGVTHPYSWHEAMSRVVRIFFGMSGYDEFMAGAFWFFRGLLLASLGYLILRRLLYTRTRLSDTKATAVIMLFCMAFIAFRFANGVKIGIIPNGGLRETWGLFFFGAGVLFRRYEDMFRRRWPLLLLAFLFILGAGKLHTCGMNNDGEFINLLTLPLTGCIGFLMIYWASGYVDSWGGRLKDLLCFIGDNTLYVLIWHIPAFKIVSLMKIHYYDLDFGQIGCHMVIHFNNHADQFWILYSIVGVAVPLLIIWAWRRYIPAIHWSLNLRKTT
ncbi:MAG: acyltransferase family protein [Muribaculaceae bacterium]|nr:acyltransferase family protein [Muribaculaceae bacterium]